MMCSWSQEEACSLPWATGKLYSLGFSTYPLGVSAGNCIPLNQGFHGHEKLKPWVINTLPQCLSPWASSRQNHVNKSLAWTLSHRFYSRPLTYARGQRGKSSWQFSSYQLLPQKDQARLSARIATQTQCPWGQGTARNRAGRCASSISEHGREDTAVWMCRHHRHTAASTARESLTPAAKAWLDDYSRVHTSKRLSSNVPSFGTQPHVFAVC